MKNFFLSLKTTVWTLFALVCVFFVGSYLMPMHKDVHGAMNDRLLFDWVREAALPNVAATWWFFASLAGLTLLTVNTIVCSIQAIKGRWSREDFLLRIAPQVVHIGFLFILLAHLLGAVWGYRISGALREGSYASLPEGRTLALRSVRVEPDPAGGLKDWSADVQVFEDQTLVATGMLGPNRPLLYKGTGIYLKSFGYEPVPYALLMVNKDPGAPWALVGSLLFLFGSVTLLVLKWKKA